MPFRKLRDHLNTWLRATTGKGAERIEWKLVDGRLVVTARGFLSDYEQKLLAANPNDPRFLEPLTAIRTELAKQVQGEWDEFLTATIGPAARQEPVEVDLLSDRITWVFVNDSG